MRLIQSIIISIFVAMTSPLFANGKCCSKMGGVQYCDSSAGRMVCKNGFYSSCYCTRHAIMDLQLLQGCCLWQGGVMPTYDTTGLVVCNDGSISEECSISKENNRVGIY